MLTESGMIVLPSSLPATASSLEEEGVYLIDDGEVFWIFVGEQVDPNVLYNVKIN